MAIKGFIKRSVNTFIGSVVYRVGGIMNGGIAIGQGEASNQSQYGKKYDINLTSGGLRKEGDELTFFPTKDEAFENFIARLQEIIPVDAQAAIMRGMPETIVHEDKYCVVARLHFM